MYSLPSLHGTLTMTNGCYCCAKLILPELGLKLLLLFANVICLFLTIDMVYLSILLVLVAWDYRIFLIFVAGFNSTLRQGNITHHEYIQVNYTRKLTVYVEFFCFFYGCLIAAPSHTGWKGKGCWIKPDCPIWRESGRWKWRTSP